MSSSAKPTPAVTSDWKGCASGMSFDFKPGTTLQRLCHLQAWPWCRFSVPHLICSKVQPLGEARVEDRKHDVWGFCSVPATTRRHRARRRSAAGGHLMTSTAAYQRSLSFVRVPGLAGHLLSIVPGPSDISVCTLLEGLPVSLYSSRLLQGTCALCAMIHACGNPQHTIAWPDRRRDELWSPLKRRTAASPPPLTSASNCGIVQSVSVRPATVIPGPFRICRLGQLMIGFDPSRPPQQKGNGILNADLRRQAPSEFTGCGVATTPNACGLKHDYLSLKRETHSHLHPSVGAGRDTIMAPSVRLHSPAPKICGGPGPAVESRLTMQEIDSPVAPPWAPPGGVF